MSTPNEKGEIPSHPHAYAGPEGYGQPAQYNQPPPYGQPMYPQAGQPQPGQYGQPVQYGQPGQMVMQTQPIPGSVVVVQQQAKPPNYLGLSIFTCLCCNIIFGLIAIIFATMSDSAYSSGDIEDARSKGRVAMGLSIGGIVCSIVTVTIVLIMLFTGVFGFYYYIG